MPHPHTSEAHHTTLINTHPKLFSQPSSAYIRSSSLKPHQHTSEAHLSTLISTHPKPISQPSSAHIRSPSLKPHQHTSEAHLSSHTKQSPKLRISINQSISQPIRPTIFFHNYNPKYSKNKFKYYTKTPHPIQNSLYPQSVGTRCVGVSRWSYLAPGASDGRYSAATSRRVSPHLSELGTHQRTWRVMGRPARQKTQTLSMTRRNDRTRHDHTAAPLADCPFVPPFIPQKKSPQAQTPRNSPKTKQHHLLRSFLSSLSSRSARAFSLNVFTLSSLRPCSIPWAIP